MRLPSLALVLLLSAAQNPTPPAATIEGRVLRTGSGEPIPNTPVTLISSSGLSDSALASMLDQMSQLVTIGLQGGGGGGSQDITIRQVASLLQSAGPGVGAQASVLTDRAGHFAFTNLPRGRYTVWVQRFNYYGPLLNGVPASTASFTLTFDPSKPTPPIDLFMTQGMAITGRVLDSRGRPPTLGMPVSAYRSTFRDGETVWTTVLQRPIDDRGEYRLSPLPPGDYYVGVTPPQGAAVPSGDNPSVRTFYPGVTEPSEATKLVLKSSDTPGVDFTLRTAPATSFKVSGFAVNPTPTPNPAGVFDAGFGNFILMPIETHLIDSFTPNTFLNVIPATNRAAGEFEIRNVRPGVYELYPSFPYAGFLSGRTVVDVRSGDVPGVRVMVNPVVQMQGRVVVQQAPQRAVKLDSLRVALKQSNAPPVLGSAPPLVPVNESGQFTVSGPGGALASLQITGLPDNAFVSDIRIGVNSVFNTGFELSSASEGLEVVIDAETGTTIETRVQTADGMPAPRATVVLVPSEDRRQNPLGYKVGTTDNAGRLTIRGVAPGTYTAFAWESVPETAWQNRDFVAKYLDQGASITASGAQMSLQLKWIPFDADLR